MRFRLGWRRKLSGGVSRSCRASGHAKRPERRRQDGDRSLAPGRIRFSILRLRMKSKQSSSQAPAIAIATQRRRFRAGSVGGLPFRAMTWKLKRNFAKRVSRRRCRTAMAQSTRWRWLLMATTALQIRPADSMKICSPLMVQIHHSAALQVRHNHTLAGDALNESPQARALD